MSEQTVVFGVEDVTSYTALRPIAEALPADVDVEFLFVDSLFQGPTSHDVTIPAATKARHEHVNMPEYVRLDTPLFQHFPAGTARAITQKLLLDDVSYQIGYDVRGYLDDVDPDAFVCAMDSLPFIRHVIVEAHDRDTTTMVLQHGLYPKNLSPTSIEGRNGAFSPAFGPRVGPAETIKRWLGYRYGITVYCNPYVDEVWTLGEFFTDRIAALREDYPCFGKTDLVTTGSPEYDGAVEPYDGRTDSFLFLSQQQYEGGEWDDEMLGTAIDVLSTVDEQTPVTVRPHPKDCQAKIDRYAEHFDVSGRDSLAADVAAHDVIATTHSTAVFEGVIQGKLCAKLDLPWENEHCPPGFPAFSHEHLVDVDGSGVDLDRAAAERSVETQREYLEQFCHMPAATGDHDSSLDAIMSRIEAALP